MYQILPLNGEFLQNENALFYNRLTGDKVLEDLCNAS